MLGQHALPLLPDNIGELAAHPGQLLLFHDAVS